MNVIEINQLTKIYKSSKNNIEVKALDNFSLSVREGEIISLLGPNGAGKTTLIKTMLGIVFPTLGSANILGFDISDYRFKSQIGFLPENHRFPLYLTAEQTLKYFADLSGVRIDNINSKIDKLLELVKMSRWKKSKISKFSKGMMQRLGLAQALINDPKIIFLDEPTDGVDPVGRKDIRDILEELKNRGKTIFLNSHLLSEVELVSDRVAIMNSGKLLKVGNVEELTTSKEGYVIETATPLNDSKIISGFDNITVELEKANRLNVNVKDNMELNFVIDKLRKEGIYIKTISIQKQSLEELFLSLISDERGGAK